jgi:hypothetical protein
MALWWITPSSQNGRQSQKAKLINLVFIQALQKKMNINMHVEDSNNNNTK